jgi:NTE family protein
LNTLPLNRIKRSEEDILVAVNASAPEDPTLAVPKANTQQDTDFWKRMLHKLPLIKDKLSDNVLMMALRLCQIVVETNTEATLKIAPPDISIDVPINRYGVLEFDKGDEIIEYGRSQMEKKLIEREYNQ